MNLFDAIDATWPPAETVDRDGWRLRRGAGGGKRVSAASRLDPDADIEVAEAAMAAWGQPLLFQLRGGESDLDAALAGRGYAVVDPVIVYAAPAAALADDASEMSRVYRCAGPMALIEEIWAAGGIGPERLAVMERAVAPKVWLVARIEDRPGGAAFVSIHEGVAMIHAIEVAAPKRRKGAGEMLLRAAARFAAENGAETLALAVTRANDGANALYAKLGMTPAAEYHYRIR